MRTVVNGLFLAQPVSGVRLVGRELLRGLVAEAADPGSDWCGALAVATSASALPLPAGMSEPPASVSIARMPGSRLGEQLSLPLLAGRDRILNFCNTMPLLAGRSVLWLHDTHVLDAPDSYAPAYRLWTRAIVASAQARGTQLVTVSEFSKRRLEAHGLGGGKVVVIPNGGDHYQHLAPDPAVLAKHELEPQGFMLVMGSPAKHKNLPFAIDALTRRSPNRLKIAVVGLHQAGPYAQEQLSRADPRLVLLPHLSDAEVRAV